MKFRKGTVAVVVLGVALLFGSHCGWAALPVYLELEGVSQGRIEGSCDIKGREGTIVVFSLGHNVVVPTDAASGLPTGRRQHSPLKILKEIDKSSPKLYRALVTGERMRRFILRFYRIGKTGLEENYFTIELENAAIVSITPSFPTAFLSQNESYRHMETVAFVYERIKWTWVDGGITAEDVWEVLR
jgi:type VI secretion system secreted protein Hcp